MKIKQKNWIWYLGFFFNSHKNYTTIWDTIYYPKGYPPSQHIVDHEKIHMYQQMRIGFWKYTFLYLFCLPLFYNPWRYKWELEAYVHGSMLPENLAKDMLGSYKYGWLKSFKK